MTRSISRALDSDPARGRRLPGVLRTAVTGTPKTPFDPRDNSHAVGPSIGGIVENAIETVAAVEAGARESTVVEVTERTYFVPLFSGVTAFETDDGLVLVDTGLGQLAPHVAAALREHTAAPVDTVVYTHGHVDHAYGLSPYLLAAQADPEIVAHEAIVDRFERYRRTRGHNEAINARQFGGTVDLADAQPSARGGRVGQLSTAIRGLFASELGDSSTGCDFPVQ